MKKPSTKTVCRRGKRLDELKTVLARDKFRHYMPEDVRQHFVQMMESNVRLLVARNVECFSARPVCRDPEDNKFLSLAFEAEADAIVSSDEDLLVLDPWGEVRILRPAEFLKEVG